MTKEAKPDEVPPWGTFRYHIELENQDSADVTGVTVNETLPGLLGQDFEFLEMVSGDLVPSVNGRQMTWNGITVPGGDTLDLRFDVRASLLFGTYNNQLTASCPHTPFAPPDEDIEARVTVLPGVILMKTVRPTQTVNGGMVVYTVTLNNQSDQTLTDIIITDTLPSGFSHRHTLFGPVPVRRSPVVVWELDELKKSSSQNFVFRAQVGYQVISGTYSNRVEGYSPSALIPTVDETAPVEVEWRDWPLVYLPAVLKASP